LGWYRALFSSGCAAPPPISLPAHSSPGTRQGRSAEEAPEARNLVRGLTCFARGLLAFPADRRGLKGRG
jgi:hypothetical protein